MSEDKKTASVSLFTNFENGVSYEISVKGSDEVATLVAAVGNPTTMTITSKSGMQGGVLVYTNTPTDLTFTLFDEFGNDITNKKNGYVIYTAANATTADYYVSGESVCIYKEGSEVAVNAEYFTGVYDDNGYEKTIKATGYFVGVTKAADSIASISMATKQYGNAYANNQIPLNDTDAIFELKIKTTAQNDSEQTYWNGKEVLLLDATGNTKIRLRTSNPDVLDINSIVTENEDGTFTYTDKLKLFKEGTAAVLVELVTANADGTETVNTIAATYVTVTAKRAVSGITSAGVVTVGTVPGFNEESLNVTAKDQYGSLVEIKNIKEAKLVDGTDVLASLTLTSLADNNYSTNKIKVNSSIMGDKTFADGKNEMTLNVVAKVVAGTWQIADYEQEIRFRVIVKRPAGAETYSVETAGTTSGNVGRFVTPYDGNGNTEGVKTAEFKVFTKSNGVKTGQEVITAKSTTAVPAGVSAGALYYSVTRDGVDVTDLTYVDENGTVKLDYSTTTTQNPTVNKGQINVVTYKDGNKNIGAGNYVFTLYKVVEDSTKTKQSFAYVASANAKVSVDTGSYTFVKRVSETANHTTNGVEYTYLTSREETPQYGLWNWDNLSALRYAFEIKDRNGNVVKDTVFSVDAVDDVNLDYVHVKSITFYEDLGDGSYAPYTVNINVSLKK